MTTRSAGPGLPPDELRRYSRHLTLPEVGIDGQLRLRSASVVLVGAGGLGSPAALYLAAAGVGRIGIVDDDRVDLSNLQRQVLHGTDDLGRSKVASARDRLARINPHVEVVGHETRIGALNALEILAPYDVVVDGSDNFPTRYLINDATVRLGKPNVHGSIFRFEGQVSVFWAGHGPCYRCLYPEPPAPGEVPSCAEGGVLGILPGVIGALQATEAIKLLLGRGRPLVGRLLLFDALEATFRELELRRDPECPACGDHPTIGELQDVDAGCAVAPGRAPTIGPRELARRLAGGEAPQLVDVREVAEWRLGRIEGACLVPLGELPARVAELDPAREVVVYCHVGGRSAVAAEILRRLGFPRVLDLAGGIDAWSLEVDPSIPRY